jgi:hypothetical protein
MRARLPRLVLFVAIFLATQAPVHLHSAIHPAGGLDSGCAVCLNGSGGTAVVPPAETGRVVPNAPDAWRSPGVAAVGPLRTVSRARARAPPSSA